MHSLQIPVSKASRPATRNNHQTTSSPVRLNKTALNFWVDTALLVLFIATGVTAYTDKQLHQTLGLVTTAFVPLHLWLHWSWISAMATRLRQIKSHTRLKVGLNLGMLLAFLLVIGSGLIIMLIWAPAVGSFHSLMVYLFVALVAGHIGLNAKWVANQIKQRLPGGNRRPAARVKSVA